LVSAVDKDAEYALLLKNIPGVVARYAAGWKRMREEGADMQANY